MYLILKMAQKHIDQGLLMITSEIEQHSVIQIQKLFTTAKGKFLCDGIASDLFKV